MLFLVPPLLLLELPASLWVPGLPPRQIGIDTQLLLAQLMRLAPLMMLTPLVLLLLLLPGLLDFVWVLAELPLPSWIPGEVVLHHRLLHC